MFKVIFVLIKFSLFTSMNEHFAAPNKIYVTGFSNSF